MIGSGSEAEHKLAQELLDHGHVVETGFPGVHGHGPQFEAAIEGVQRAFCALEETDIPISRLVFPPLIPTERFLRTDYLASFPQLTGEVEVFRGGDREHRDLLGRLRDGENWTEVFEPSGLAQIPATCEQVYPLFSGVLEHPARVEARSWCFRFEPSEDPLRMVTFRICEQVYVGTAEGAEHHRNLWRDNIVGMFDSFGLDVAVNDANDPFFGRAGRIMAAGQLQDRLKDEISVQIYRDRRTAISSSNAHRTHFAENFDIRLPDGSHAHSSCAGFGVERVVIALLVQHGMAVDAWPARVRRVLGLD